MEESSHSRPPVKGLQGVGISASLWLPIGLKSYWSTEWKQIHEPGSRTCDTSKRSHSVEPLPLGQCGMPFHSHPNETKSSCLPSHSFLLRLAFPVFHPTNTWVPLLFYCLSKPLKLNVRPCYWAYTSSGTVAFHRTNSFGIKIDSVPRLDVCH